MRRAGFTLLELLVVIVVVGVLVAMSLAQFTLAAEKSKAAEAVRIMDALRIAQLAYFSENGKYQQEGSWNDPRGLLVSIAPGTFFLWVPCDGITTGSPDLADENRVGAVARVSRKSGGPFGQYLFKIQPDGKILCRDDTSSPGTCQKLGYDTY